MSRELASDDKKVVKKAKPITKPVDKQSSVGPSPAVGGVLSLQQRVGNQAVQRFLAQRSGEGSFELDDDTSERINQARGGGQTLSEQTQEQMGQAMGYDFSTVKVHTSSEADSLNQDLSARAFTTGNDIFFKDGEYNPNSSGGQELLGHELTHVVQQNSGAVSGGGSGMTVNAPNDAYEQEADAVAQQVVQQDAAEIQTAGSGEVQREAIPDEEEMVQGKFIQREEIPEEEEMLQGKFIQREEIPEEEMI